MYFNSIPSVVPVFLETLHEILRMANETPGLALTARTEYKITSTSSKSSANTTSDLSSQISPLITAVENETSFPEDALEGQVCLGWLHWTIGEPGLALSRIPDVDRVTERLTTAGRTLSGWTHVCIVKGAYIRG